MVVTPKSLLLLPYDNSCCSQSLEGCELFRQHNRHVAAWVWFVCVIFERTDTSRRENIFFFTQRDCQEEEWQNTR